MGSMIAGWVDDIVPVDVCRQFTTERDFFEVGLGPLHGEYLDLECFPAGYVNPLISPWQLDLALAKRGKVGEGESRESN